MNKDLKIDEKEYQKIGRRIKILRVNSDLSQAELAKRLGMAQAGLSAMEHGKTHPSLRRLIQMRDILGCTMSDFFEEETTAEDDISLEEIVEAMRIMKQIKLAEAKEN